MRRLCVLLLSCQPNIYAPLQTTGTTGATTITGGTGHNDLSVLPDGSSPSLPAGTVRAHSGSQSLVSADFAECPSRLVSGCLFRDCAPADLAVPAYSVNIGTIHVTSPTADVMLPPASDGQYVTLIRSGPLWSVAGAKVTISGSGADYPAFDVILDGPTAVTVTNPLAGALDVPRTADFSVSWTGGTTGHVTVEIAGTTQSLSCDFALASGSAFVPRQALSELTAGAATLTVLVASTTTVDSVVQVLADVSGEDAGGMPFSAAVNLK
jgi:hypothetical protein